MSIALKFPSRIAITPERLAYLFAAYHGLAYYAIIILVSPILPYEKGAFRFCTTLLFLGLACGVFLKNQFMPTNRLPLPMGIKFLLAYFVWSGLSFLWGNPGESLTQGHNLTLYYLAQWANYLAELLTIVLICRVAPIHSIAPAYFKGLRIGGVLLAVTFLLFWFFGDKSGRLGLDGMMHPNMLAMKLAISVLCSLHLFFQDSRTDRGSKLLKAGAVIVPMLFALVLTVGKTVLLGFMLAFIFYCSIVRTEVRSKISILGLSILVFALATPYIIDYVLNYMATDNLMTLTGRTELWGVTWEEIIKKPIIGHGVNTPFPGLSWNEAIGKEGHSGSAHNDYLNALYEMGVVGLFIVGMMYLLFFLTAVSAWRNKATKPKAVLGVAVFILMFTYSLTASFPVGFCMPVTFQAIMLMWMSVRYNSTQTPPASLRPYASGIYTSTDYQAV